LRKTEETQYPITKGIVNWFLNPVEDLAEEGEKRLIGEVEQSLNGALKEPTESETVDFQKTSLKWSMKNKHRNCLYSNKITERSNVKKCPFCNP
jgi:hypothetical protein